MKKVIWDKESAENAAGGKSTAQWQASGISIDTRTLKPGDLFIALKGEKSDGHQFLADAVGKKAAAAIVEHVPEGIDKKFPLLVVKDALKALQDMARFRRKQTKAKIIGITGSVGKTSVKEGLNAVLAQFGSTHSTQGNFNNHIGLPISLVSMPEDVDYGVFELGMSGAGEISFLSKILQPEISIITDVKPMHLEFFNSVEDIARAKAEIFDGMGQGKTAIIPADNPHYKILKNAAEKQQLDILSFGRNSHSSILLLNNKMQSDGQQIELGYEGQKVTCKIAALGDHQAMNSLAIFAAALSAGIKLEKLLPAMDKFASSEGRGKLSKISFSGKQIILIDDSYNAGPDSMRAAFAVLSSLKKVGKSGRAIALLGDMLELGKDTEKFHTELAKDIAANDIDKVFTAGSLMRNLAGALPKEKNAGHFNKPEEIVPELKKIVRDGDLLLIKGSHGSNMWKLPQLIMKG